MTAVAKLMAEIKVEVLGITAARENLQSGNQKEALVDIAVSGMKSSEKAEEIIKKIVRMRNDIEGYLEKVKDAAD